VLVVGAGGMLGKALLERLRSDHDVVGTDRRSLSITDRHQIRDRLEEIDPDVAINCAAMTNVDACERDPVEAQFENAVGPGTLAKACDARGVELIHISTDYVFDGTKGEPHTEADPVNPINAYGDSKLLGEQTVTRSCERHKILRVSMLYGIHRSNFADFVARCIEQGRPVPALTDNTGSPTHCANLADQIAALIGRPETGIFHCAGAGGCSRFAFAERIRDLWPAPDLVIETKTQEDFPQMLAARPADSRLDCARLKAMNLLRLKPWEEAVGDYLEARRAAQSARETG
jgi:dTDP-4-dehydrorhamnose reductase